MFICDDSYAKINVILNIYIEEWKQITLIIWDAFIGLTLYKLLVHVYLWSYFFFISYLFL